MLINLLDENTMDYRFCRSLIIANCIKLSRKLNRNLGIPKTKQYLNRHVWMNLVSNSGSISIQRWGQGQNCFKICSFWNMAECHLWRCTLAEIWCSCLKMFLWFGVVWVVNIRYTGIPQDGLQHVLKTNKQHHNYIQSLYYYDSHVMVHTDLNKLCSLHVFR